MGISYIEPAWKNGGPFKILPLWCLSDVILFLTKPFLRLSWCPWSMADLGSGFFQGLRVVGLIILGVQMCFSDIYVGWIAETRLTFWFEETGAGLRKAKKKSDHMWPAVHPSPARAVVGGLYQARVTASLGRHRALRAGLGFWWRGLFVFSQLLKPGSVF